MVAIDEEEEQIDEKSNPSPTKNVLLNKENVSIDVNDERINAEEAQNIKEKNLKGLEVII